MKVQLKGKVVETAIPVNAMRYNDVPEDGGIFRWVTGPRKGETFMRTQDGYQLNLVTGTRHNLDEAYNNPIVEFYPDAYIELGDRQELRPDIKRRTIKVQLTDDGQVDSIETEDTAEIDTGAKKKK